MLGALLPFFSKKVVQKVMLREQKCVIQRKSKNSQSIAGVRKFDVRKLLALFFFLPILRLLLLLDKDSARQLLWIII